MDKKSALVLAFLIVILLAFDIFFFSSTSAEIERESASLKRAIDGDTIVIADGRTIRLLNINSPEKNFYNSNLSFLFLKAYENRTIKIEITGTDKYDRHLARLYSSDSEYLNLKLVQLGLASKFLVQDEELKKFRNAEEDAIENALGIWSHSKFFNCFKSKIDYSSEIVYLNSKCGSIDMSGWVLKDESRKTFKFSLVLNNEIRLHSGKGINNQTDLFWGAENIWNNDRDSLYLFDSTGKIAHNEVYGY